MLPMEGDLDESADPSGKFLLVELPVDAVRSAGDDVIEAQLDSVGGCLGASGTGGEGSTVNGGSCGLGAAGSKLVDRANASAS